MLVLVSGSQPGATTRPAAIVTIPPHPTTTQPGAVITIPPGGTAPTIIGPHNDSSDFWALGFALLGIVVAIVLVRLVFRSRARSVRQPEERRPGASGGTDTEGP